MCSIFACDAHRRNVLGCTPKISQVFWLVKYLKVKIIHYYLALVTKLHTMN
jgi:hypothetical protein